MSGLVQVWLIITTSIFEQETGTPTVFYLPAQKQHLSSWWINEINLSCEEIEVCEPNVCIQQSADCEQ